MLAALTGGYIWFNERGPATREGAIELLRAPRNSIQIVRLENAGKRVELRRAGASWQVAESSRKDGVPADEDAVQALLETLELVQSDAPVQGQSDLKSFGLDKPARKIFVDEQMLELGAKSPFDPNRIYARANGKIALVPASLAEAPAKPFDLWRDKRVLRFDAEAVDSLSIQAPKVTAKFAKSGGNWRFTAPIEARADQTAVTNFLSTLGSANVTRWLDTNTANLGFEKPLATLQIGESSLTVGKKLADGYAARNNRWPGAFVVSGGIFEAFNAPLGAWRAKRVFGFKAADATRFTLSARGKTETLKLYERWQIEGGPREPIHNSRALDVVLWAADLEATGFVDEPGALASYGLEVPELVLEMEAGETTLVKIGRAKGQLYALLSDGTVAILSSDALDELKPALDLFFPRAAKP